MSAYPPPPQGPPQGYVAPGAQYPYTPQDAPHSGQPGYPQPYAPPGGVPPYGQYGQYAQYGQYQTPLPGQPGYQWGVAPAPYQFAGFGPRFGALLLDGLIVGVPLMIVYAIAFSLFFAGLNPVTDATGEFVDANPNSAVLGVGGVLFLVVLLIAFLYEPLMTARKGPGNGQTIGKKIVGIRVVNMQNGPITTGQAWGRYLLKSLVSGSVFYLGYLWALWDTNQQTWHDKIVNTVVVRA